MTSFTARVADPDPGSRAAKLVIPFADHEGIAGAVQDITETHFPIIKNALSVSCSLEVVAGSPIPHVVGNRGAEVPQSGRAGPFAATKMFLAVDQPIVRIAGADKGGERRLQRFALRGMREIRVQSRQHVAERVLGYA